MVTLKEVAGGEDHLMGVKAVWGRSNEPVMCFGSRGNPALRDNAFFSVARATAERALTRPYFLTIGGGREVPNELAGRVLELVRATGVYGETNAFVRDPDLRKRLAAWPVAIVVSEVYLVVGEPRLVEDIGLPDRRILTNAFDAVVRPDDVARLWRALENHELRRRWDIPPLPYFRDPQKVRQCGTHYPQVRASSTEGKRIWKQSVEIERDPRLARAAKDANRSLHGGELVCSACGFRDRLDKMFDAHHLDPLACGIRETRVDDLAVMCPTCHRWVHAKSPDLLTPLAVSVVARALSSAFRSDPTRAPFEKPVL